MDWIHKPVEGGAKLRSHLAALLVFRQLAEKYLRYVTRTSSWSLNIEDNSSSTLMTDDTDDHVFTQVKPKPRIKIV